MGLGDWPIGTTKAFSGSITIGGAAPDISGDIVVLRLKGSRDDLDASAIVTKTADVASQGSNGVYIMEVVPSDTASVSPGRYYYDIVLERSTGAEYVLESGVVNLLVRVSDA